MAPRAPQKAKSPTAKPPAKRRAPAKVEKKASAAELTRALERLETKVMGLQQERDALASELETVRAKMRQLEEAQTDAVNRIDWVIDSLHNILEEKS